ncbi:MAG: zinc-ribbon domain-containing protein [Ruminococcaceae bacterium]|nr:zinc-ribbon domain-containing protein [Oscillospiraceae bacterium]
MGFFDDLKEKFRPVGEKLSESGKKAVDKTKELAQIAKLSLSVNEEEKKITEMFANIGREYVERFANDEDRILPEVIAEIFEAKKRVEKLNERIRELKGETLCSSCKAKMDDGAKFCPECGAAADNKDEECEEAPAQIESAE